MSTPEDLPNIDAHEFRYRIMAEIDRLRGQPDPSAFASGWAACRDDIVARLDKAINAEGSHNARRALGEFQAAIAALTPPPDAWRPMSSAPKDGTPFLAWCPIIPGLGDWEATPDGEWRVLWWEARGQFTSDRDLGNEHFIGWYPLPHPSVVKDHLTTGSSHPLPHPPQDGSGE